MKYLWSFLQSSHLYVLALSRLASHQVWGEASEESETSEDDDLADGSKDEDRDQLQRSGKLLVLQQILPLWHEQVGIAIVVVDLINICFLHPRPSLVVPGQNFDSSSSSPRCASIRIDIRLFRRVTGFSSSLKLARC